VSNVLQRVAAVHRERVAKHEKVRQTNQRKLDMRRLHFVDSGIPEMWNDVKDIVIKNPIPDRLEGLKIPLQSLWIAADNDNVERTGLALQDKDCDVCWTVNDLSTNQSETPNLQYHVNCGKTNLHIKIDSPDAKQKFVDSFVKWLSKHITAHMIVEMDIDIEAPSVVKRSRKILQLTDT